MKKRVYFLMGTLLVLLCGCGKTQDTSVDMQKTTAAEYQVLDGWTEEKADDIVYFTPDAYKVGDEASCPAYMTASGYIQKFDTSDDWGVMKDGKIEQVYTDNHASAEVDGSIDGLCAPGYLMKVDYDLYSAAELEKEKEDGTDMSEIDQTAQYWVLYLAREGEETGYILALNTRNYTREDMLAWAKNFIF